MKKTIITLLALAGVAAGTDATLVWDMSFAPTDSQDSVTDANGNSYTLGKEWKNTQGNSGSVISPYASRLLLTDSNASVLTFAQDFSFVVQGGLNQVGAWDCLMSIGSDNNNNFKIVNNASGCLTFLEEGTFSVSTDGHPNTTKSVTGEMGTYIVTYNATGKDLTLFYNGTEVATADLLEVTNENKVANFAIGGRALSMNNTSDFTFSNIQLYSGVLSSEQIKSLSVPEPTTATLSLLALAGLAARRRRR